MFELDLLQGLLHGALELVGNLGIPVSVEDSPLVHSCLCEHLGLSLPVELSGCLVNVDFVGSTRTGRTHDKVTGFIVVASELCGDLLEANMPSLGLLFALLVLGERSEEILALLHFLLSVGVNDLGEVLHEPEVSSHLIGQSCELTELRNESNFVTSLAVLVDEERLVDISDRLVVPGFVVFLVANLSAILIESCLG